MNPNGLLLDGDVGHIANPAVHGADHVRLVVIQHPNQFPGACVEHPQGDPRVVPAEPVKIPGNQGVAQGVRHSQPDAAPDGLILPGPHGHFPGKLADPLGIIQSLPPGIRQGHGMPDAVKQRHPQLLLQLPDLKGHRGLGIAQVLPCPGEAAALRHLQKCLQTAKIHVFTSAFNIFILTIKSIN